MSTGLDIKEAVVDVGSSFTIIRESGTIAGGYLDFEVNSQATKPFIRGFFVEATLAYDTAVVEGDIVNVPNLDGQFMVMNNTAEAFENEVVDYNAVLYRCNVSGEIHRFSGETWDTQTYDHKSVWEVIATSCYALCTENLFGTELDQDEEFVQLGLESSSLYIPHNKGIRLMDRFVVASGEYYKVDSVHKRQFGGVDVCKLEEDTRQ